MAKDNKLNFKFDFLDSDSDKEPQDNNANIVNDSSTEESSETQIKNEDISTTTDNNKNNETINNTDNNETLKENSNIQQEKYKSKENTGYPTQQNYSTRLIIIGIILISMLVLIVFAVQNDNYSYDTPSSYVNIDYKRNFAYNSYLDNKGNEAIYMELVNELASYDGITPEQEIKKFEERKLSERDGVINIAIEKFVYNSNYDFEAYKNIIVRRYFDNDTSAFNQFFEDKYGKKVFTLEEQTMPKTSVLFSAKWVNSVKPLALYIKASSQYNYMIILYNKNTSKPDFAVFVNAGEDITVNVPASTYVLYYAKGEKWYGGDYQFGYKTVYNRLDKDLLFSSWNHNFDCYSLNFNDYPNTSELYKDTVVLDINSNNETITENNFRLNAHQKIQISAERTEETEFINMYNSVKSNHQTIVSIPKAKTISNKKTYSNTNNTQENNVQQTDRYSKYELIDGFYTQRHGLIEKQLESYRSACPDARIIYENGKYYIKLGIFYSKIEAEQAKEQLFIDGHITEVREINE